MAVARRTKARLGGNLTHPVANTALVSGVALGALALGNALAGRWAEARHPPSGRFVEVDGVRIHYVSAGEGPPVVLLHGNGASAEDFVLSGLFQELARRYHVVAPDRPGFGYTERPRSRIWSAAAQARLVQGFVERLGLARPIAVGHSWGTLVALSLALDTPTPLAGLALLSGFYYPTPRPDVVALSAPALPVIGDVLRYTASPLLGRAAAPALFRRIFAPRPVPARFKAGFSTGMALRPGQIRASAEDTAAMLPCAAALAGRYDELDLPTAILAGADDRIVSTGQQAERLHGDIAGSTLAILPGLGHMIHYAVPGQIGDVLDRLRTR